MRVLDAQALIAFFADEPGRPMMQGLLHSSEQLLLSAANLAEVAYFLGRFADATPAVVYADVVELGVRVSRVDEELAIAAAELRLKHYHRELCAVSLIDCIAAALALDRGAALVTSDPHLLDVVHAEGGDVTPLPSSAGTTWPNSSI